MPVMTGLELCRLLRGKLDHGELPIILVTAMNDLATLAMGFTMGVTDFIGKPYSPIELEARVKSLPRRKRAEEGWRRYHDYVMAEREVIERLLRRMGGVGDFDGRGVRHLIHPAPPPGGRHHLDGADPLAMTPAHGCGSMASWIHTMPESRHGCPARNRRGCPCPARR